MSATQRISLQSAGDPVAATAQGGRKELLQATMGVLYLDVTAVSGSSTPQLSAWLQGSNDDGTTWFDLFHDGALPLNTGQADQTAAAAGKRNVNGGTVVTAAGKFAAVFKHLPAKHVRLAWNVSGSFTAGQGFTFSAVLDVK